MRVCVCVYSLGHYIKLNLPTSISNGVVVVVFNFKAFYCKYVLLTKILMGTILCIPLQSDAPSSSVDSDVSFRRFLISLKAKTNK